jgi:hypothetical protein
LNAAISNWQSEKKQLAISSQQLVKAKIKSKGTKSKAKKKQVKPISAAPA